MSKEMYRQMWSDRELQPSLRSYSGEKLEVPSNEDTIVRCVDLQFTLPYN